MTHTPYGNKGMTFEGAVETAKQAAARIEGVMLITREGEGYQTYQKELLDQVQGKNLLHRAVASVAPDGAVTITRRFVEHRLVQSGMVIQEIITPLDLGPLDKAVLGADIHGWWSYSNGMLYVTESVIAATLTQWSTLENTLSDLFSVKSEIVPPLAFNSTLASPAPDQ